MNAADFIIRQTDLVLEQLFQAARELPADKLDWKPAPGARSALDQLQEVATALPMFWDMFTKREIQWDEDRFAKWAEDRSKLTDIDEIERVCRKNTEMLYEFIRSTPEDEWTQPVKLPFPMERNLSDTIAYHHWNASYHHGQIHYIKSLLDGSE